MEDHGRLSWCPTVAVHCLCGTEGPAKKKKKRRNLLSMKKTIFGGGLTDLERVFAAWSSAVDCALKFDESFPVGKRSGCQSVCYIKMLSSPFSTAPLMICL